MDTGSLADDYIERILSGQAIIQLNSKSLSMHIEMRLAYTGVPEQRKI